MNEPNMAYGDYVFYGIILRLGLALLIRPQVKLLMYLDYISMLLQCLYMLGSLIPDIGILFLQLLDISHEAAIASSRIWKELLHLEVYRS